ncbi:hypothetical protein ACFY7H_24855 [Streptomyces sp. NPDC012794]|uniref:hypothetical protein n=1 Tax=Streptomyces sp. NPDC012794 TaxID=3364850 RepID=UPI0036B19A92
MNARKPAVRAARRMEATASEVGYWAAHCAKKDATPAQTAAALGLTEAAARSELARLGRWGRYQA